MTKLDKFHQFTDRQVWNMIVRYMFELENNNENFETIGYKIINGRKRYEFTIDDRFFKIEQLDENDLKNDI